MSVRSTSLIVSAPVVVRAALVSARFALRWPPSCRVSNGMPLSPQRSSLRWPKLPSVLKVSTSWVPAELTEMVYGRLP